MEHDYTVVMEITRIIKFIVFNKHSIHHVVHNYTFILVVFIKQLMHIYLSKKIMQNRSKYYTNNYKIYILYTCYLFTISNYSIYPKIYQLNYYLYLHFYYQYTKMNYRKEDSHYYLNQYVYSYE